MLTPRLACLVIFTWSVGLACTSNDPAPVPQQPDAGSVDASGRETSSDAEIPDACSAPSTGDLPCDVAAVLAICQTCHQMPPVRGAPFPFLTYEDTQAVYFGAMLRWERMAQVIEPNEPLHMPPTTATDVPQLTDQQLDTLRAWFRACTPPEAEGQGCDKGESP